MQQYTLDEMMQFFQEGKVPPTQQAMSFESMYEILDREFLPRMVAHLNSRGIGNVNVHLEPIQNMDGEPTANISFWHKSPQGNQWMQEFACAINYEGLPYFMPVQRQS